MQIGSKQRSLPQEAFFIPTNPLPNAIFHPLNPCRPSTRRTIRSNDPADLHDFNLHPRSPRQIQIFRLHPLQKPKLRQPRTNPRIPRKRLTCNGFLFRTWRDYGHRLHSQTRRQSHRHQRFIRRNLQIIHFRFFKLRHRLRTR